MRPVCETSGVEHAIDECEGADALRLRQSMSRGSRTLTALVGLAVPFLAGGFVVSRASGAYQVDALGPASRSVLAFAPTTVLLIAVSLSGRRMLMLTGVGTAVLATAFTIWLVRPQAPTGDEFPSSFPSAQVSIVDDVVAALRAVHHPPTTTDASSLYPPGDPCVDSFGRSRGAVDSATQLDVTGHLTRQEFDTLADLIAAPDRSVQAPTLGYRATRRPYTITLLTHPDSNSPDQFLITTPCLRATSS